MNMRMPRRQRGIAAVIVVMLLITGVLLLLSQTSNIINLRGADTAREVDSQAALMIAESGAQRAQSIITQAQISGSMSTTVCQSGVSAGAPFTIGRGSLTYGSASTQPGSCSSSTCGTCTLQITGSVGNTTRTINVSYTLGTIFGVAGRGTQVTMVLGNQFNANSIALFELGWRRQGTGGQSTGTGTTPQVSTGGIATLLWNLLSSSGSNSVGAIGTAVPIPASSVSPVVTQTLSQSRDYVEVGGVYPAMNPTDPYPTLHGSYWSDVSGNTVTAVQTGFTGGVPSGVDLTNQNSNGCIAPSNPVTGQGTGTYQQCAQWCLDPANTGQVGKADTLVMGISARSKSVADSISSISFNTASTGSNSTTFAAQNLPLIQLVHYPNTDGSSKASTGGIVTGALYSEQWFAYNQPYTSSTSSVGASIYPNTSLLSAGATFTTAADIAKNATTFTVALNSLSGYICVGDQFPNVGGSKLGNLTITGVPGGGQCSNLTGTGNPYSLSSGGASGAVSAGAAFTLYSSRLLVVAQQGGPIAASTSFAATDPNASGGSANLTGTVVAATTLSATLNGTSSTLNYYSFGSGNKTCPAIPPATGNVNCMYLPKTANGSGPVTPYSGTVRGVTRTVYRVYVPSDDPLPADPYTVYKADGTTVDYYVDTQLQVYKALGATFGVVLPPGSIVSSVDRDPNHHYFYAYFPGVTPNFAGVQLCGGICGLFNDPGNINRTTAVTAFSITASPNTSQWASGFMCLSGVYRPNIQPIKSAAVTDRRWWESEQ